jgi:hypothetical protein
MVSSPYGVDLDGVTAAVPQAVTLGGTGDKCAVPGIVPRNCGPRNCVPGIVYRNCSELFYIDQSGADNRLVNHEGSDFCVMSYEANWHDEEAEFDVDCAYDVRDASDPR